MPSLPLQIPSPAHSNDTNPVLEGKSFVDLTEPENAHTEPSREILSPEHTQTNPPMIERYDGDGVGWIAFEYSMNQVNMEYTIRCDVESVDTDELAHEYRGNRWDWETHCNRLGWALAELNFCLRGKRGLIQRAVNIWRKSSQNPTLEPRGR
ncbi:hypothetical protein FSARC_3997 [Fusarium sarcochroum]|uniref:DUF8032 domain-containing protein n=1 Tax=Fusarium sarcochroum TaxID=1208366 RepID=A0A8H4U2S6_9HYPO|nr:hypothetical protein FSARC_3997 [Fusarium sarcochroum]